MPLPKVPKKFLPKLTSVFLLLYVAATLPLLTNRLTSFAYIVQGIVQTNKKAEGEVTDSFRKAIQANPWDGSLYWILGNQLNNQDKVNEAIAAYRQAIRLYPEDDSVYRDLGKALIKQGKHDEAIATYRQAIKVNSQWDWAYKKLGDELYYNWKLDEAIVAYRQAIQIDPNYAEAYNRLAGSLEQQGRSDEAIAAYRQAIKVNPQLGVAYDGLGNALYKNSNFDEAIVAYRQAIKIRPYTAGYLNLGKALKDAGKPEEAIATWHMIPIGGKDDIAATSYQYVGDLLNEQNKLNEAVTAYRKAIEIEPNQSDRASYYRKIGYILSKLNKLDEALIAYVKMLELKPEEDKNINGYIYLGSTLEDLGKRDKAIATYQKAIQLNPKNDVAYNSLGLTLNKQKKVNEGISAYQKAIQLNPKNAVAYNNLGWALQQQGKFEQAIEFFKKASALPQNDRNVNFSLKETERLLTMRKNPQLLTSPERLPSSKDEPLVLLKRSVVQVIVKSYPLLIPATGWVVKRQGNKAWIVTNRHVATAGKNTPQSDLNIEVEFYSEPHSGEVRKRKPAKIVKITTASNDKLDLALLEVTDIPKDIQPLTRSSASVALNAPIRIIGYPSTTDNSTVATGEVINIIFNNRVLRTSATGSPGNCGSPVLDQQNRVVGVVWGDQVQTKEQQRDGYGYALAFPIQSVTKQLKDWGID